jgi:hypothetical protein
MTQDMTPSPQTQSGWKWPTEPEVVVIDGQSYDVFGRVGDEVFLRWHDPARDTTCKEPTP